MGHPAHDIFCAALALPEAERLELASNLIKSVDGPAEPGWEDAWVEEVDQRDQVESEPGRSWAEVRSHVLGRLGWQ